MVELDVLRVSYHRTFKSQEYTVTIGSHVLTIDYHFDTLPFWVVCQNKTPVSTNVSLAYAKESLKNRVKTILDELLVDRKTSAEWLTLIDSRYKLRILDADGWNRADYEYSFNEEKITREEFNYRLSRSTIQCDPSYFSILT